MGIIPKHDGGWHTIYRLSAPHGASINDFIDPEQYSLSYCTVDNAFAIVNSLSSTYSKNRLKECIPPHPSKTRGLESARDTLEKKVLHM